MSALRHMQDADNIRTRIKSICEDEAGSKKLKAELEAAAENKEVKMTEEPMEEMGSIKDLFKYKYILLATVVNWFNWFSVSMCYYGWSLMVGEVGGDNIVRASQFLTSILLQILYLFLQYLNLVIGGSLEIGGRFGILYLSDKVGRRPFAICLLWAVTFFSTAAAILVEIGSHQFKTSVFIPVAQES